MNLFRIGISAFVAAALGLWIWQVESPRLASEARGDVVFPMNPAEVAKVELGYPGSDSIVIEKLEPGWQITTPLQYRADQDQIERFLAATAELTAERRLTGSEMADLSEYGLEAKQASASVTLTLSDETTLPTLYVGRTTPVGYSAFVRVDGQDNVAVIPLLFHSTVRKSLFDLREKSLFGLRAELIAQLELHSSAGSMRLKKTDQTWYLNDPFEGLADQASVNQLLNAAVSLKAVAFFDQPEIDREALGLGEGATQFVVRFDENSGIAFRLGKSDEENPPGTYFERSLDGQIAKIDNEKAAAFTISPWNLLDRHVYDCDAEKAAKLTIRRGAAPAFTLLRQANGEWQFAQPQSPDEKVNADAVARVLQGLSEMEGTAIVSAGVQPEEPKEPKEKDRKDDSETYGFNDPVVAVELSMSAEADSPLCETVISGVVVEGDSKATYYLRNLAKPYVYAAPPHVFSRMDIFREDFIASP